MYLFFFFFFPQCGADVNKKNSQGLTALDIVNMYTDPRTAGQMKQVLQGLWNQIPRAKNNRRSAFL